MTNDQQNLLLEELSKPMLKRFADEGAEKIRELAVVIMTYLISRCMNLIGLLPYLYPVVMDRLGHGHGFDTETNVTQKRHMHICIGENMLHCLLFTFRVAYMFPGCLSVNRNMCGNKTKTDICSRC
jgi:hypothetical protein